MAELRGLVSLREVTERLAKLFNWNVATSVSFRQLLASIPASVVETNSIAEGVGVLQGDPVASPLFEGIWNVRKTYQELVAIMGDVLTFLVQQPANRPETIAAVWGVWYLKAKLRSDVTVVPPLKHAVLVMLKATANLGSGDRGMFTLLWKVFLILVPLEYGNRMDEQKEKAAIALAGTVTAALERSFITNECNTA